MEPPIGASYRSLLLVRVYILGVGACQSVFSHSRHRTSLGFKPTIEVKLACNYQLRRLASKNHDDATRAAGHRGHAQSHPRSVFTGTGKLFVHGSAFCFFTFDAFTCGCRGAQQPGRDIVALCREARAAASKRRANQACAPGSRLMCWGWAGSRRRWHGGTSW